MCVSLHICDHCDQHALNACMHACLLDVLDA